MGLSIEPESKRPTKFILLFVLVMVGTALLWWKREIWFPDPTAQQFANSSLPAPAAPVVVDAALPPTPTLVLSTATPASPATATPAVKLVYIATITSTAVAPITEPLFLEAAESHSMPAWGGIDGRSEVITYIVKDGDTVWGIAAEFGLTLDTLRWSNPYLERNPDQLSIGDELTILPNDGLVHEIAAGETIAGIAAKFGVAEVDIINYPPNNLTADTILKAGEQVIVPNGQKALVIATPAQDTTYALAYPLVGRLTQSYHSNHLAIDLGSAYGATVYAADTGTVIYSKWAQTGYGYTIIIDHGTGLHTLYSHLKGTLVDAGASVGRGQAIGAVGSTGNSTGPHVHFEVRQDGQRLNPLDYLNPNSG